MDVIKAEDTTGCTTVNGDSHSVDSAVMSSDTVVSAADVSDGDVGVQQQHSNAVGADAPAQLSKSHHSSTSVTKHSSSSSDHKSHSSHDRSRSTDGHNDRRKSEAHRHHSSSSHRSAGDPKPGQGHSSHKSSADPKLGHCHVEVKQLGQGHKDHHHRSSSSKPHQSSSSATDPNKHRAHHERSQSSSHVSKSSSSDVKSPSSSSDVDKHRGTQSSSRVSKSSSSEVKTSSSSSDVDKRHGTQSSSHAGKSSSDIKISSSSPDIDKRHATQTKSSSDAKKMSPPSVSSPVRKTLESASKTSSLSRSHETVIETEPTGPRSPLHRDSAPSKPADDKPTTVMTEVKVEVKMEVDDDDEDEIPLSARMKLDHKNAVNNDADKHLTERVKKRKRDESGDESDTPLALRLTKKVKVEEKKKRKKPADNDEVKVKLEDGVSPKKSRGKKAVAEEDTRWKWWEEEEPRGEGVKWRTLEHCGPVFAEAYERVPASVKFYYGGRTVTLSETAEEVAGFYARMLEHDYTTREMFNSNFMKDWRKVMTSKEREVITDIRKCNFNELAEYYKRKSEERKNMSKEEKQEIKAANEKVVKEFGFCIIDGHKQKIGNFKIEPPGLFRGRGDHPKQGMLKRRVMPEDVIINCSKGSKVPAPPPGHKWKEVRHDNTVTWLASWTENVQGQTKYIMLNAASKLKGEKDWMKYETARKLHKLIRNIRNNYREDWKSKEMKIRQRAVALYFIDKLALRAGNEKDEDQADTVGCCSLRVEHIKLHEEYDGQQFVVEFDFLGKDSIRYYNRVEVEKRVFKNLQLFMENKQEGDDLFDRLNTTILNKHLQQLMDGLTAKVFRTYNASHTLQQQLDQLSTQDDEDFESQPVAAKLLEYNRANRTVAVLCNHQRAVPKNFSKQMENLQAKIDAKKEQLHAVKKEYKAAKSDYKHHKSEAMKNAMNKKQKAVGRVQEQLDKLHLQQTDKDENKEIALGTSKLNYLDPRITVAWCKKWSVPVEKVYNKTQRDKFAWAIDMADEHYVF